MVSDWKLSNQAIEATPGARLNAIVVPDNKDFTY